MTTTTTLGAFAAKKRFPTLLKQVGRGAEITITKHDRAVTRLVPAGVRTKDQRSQVTAELRLRRARYSRAGVAGRVPL